MPEEQVAVIVKFFARHRESLGWNVGQLYGTNTSGAVVVPDVNLEIESLRIGPRPEPGQIERPRVVRGGEPDMNPLLSAMIFAYGENPRSR